MKFVAIDFETGDAKRDSACSVAMVLVEDGRVVRQEVRLIKPPRLIVPGNQAVHGITNDMVKSSPPWLRVWKELAPMLEGVSVLVAHNASFDKSVLDACHKAEGIRPLEGIEWHCSVKAAKKAWPDWPSHALNACCERLGIPLQHHEALSDALACAEVYLRAEGLRLVRLEAQGSSAPTAAATPAGVSPDESSRRDVAARMNALLGRPTAPASPPRAQAPEPPPPPAAPAPEPPPSAPSVGESYLPGQALGLGRRMARGEVSPTLELADPWIEWLAFAGYHIEQLEQLLTHVLSLSMAERELLRGRFVDALQRRNQDAFKRLIDEWRQQGEAALGVKSLSRRSPVHPKCCGACGTPNVEAGKCTKCGWEKPAEEAAA
jgi:DNA polymerase-3 subunit epsilon